MEPFYLPNDPTAHERENKKWREAARYDLAEDLFFQLRDENDNWPDLIDAHAQSWHISAVRGFSCREADRGDGKYPWTSLETKLDNIDRSRFTLVRRVTLPGVLAAGLDACSFDCVGRLIRRYTPQNDGSGGLGMHGPKLGRRPRFATLALPIPTPTQRARRMMERARDSVRSIYFSQLDAGPATRQFLAKRLAHAHNAVTTGAMLNDALEYRSGHLKLTPTDIGKLWGSIEYFKRCWQDFHEAEKQVPAATPVPPLDTPAFTVIKSQAQVLSEMIAQIATDAKASANAKGFTLVDKPGNPVPAVPALDTPTAPTRVIATINAPTVADLCRLPFTPAGLNELLVRLKVISPAGTCLTNDLKGKAQGPRAAFTAAYRVLHRAELLNPVVDKVWAAAFLQAYGAKLGKCAISHKLTVHGTATAAAPLPFTEAVNIAREWVNEWQSRR